MSLSQKRPLSGTFEQFRGYSEGWAQDDMALTLWELEKVSV